MSRRSLLLAVPLCAALLLGACSSDEDDATGVSIIPTTDPPTIACAPATDIPVVEGKPDIENAPESVTELQVEDVVVGDGAELTSADDATINFVGIACSTGRQWDSTWDTGEPLALRGLVLPEAFDQGLVGMRVGGLRRLVVPPRLGFGQTGRGDVLPYETLVVMVELVGVTDLLESAAGKPCVPPTNMPEGNGQPAVSYDPGPPPTEVTITDLVVGTGDEVTEDSTMTINYAIVACSTGLQWYSTWDSGEAVRTQFSQLQTGLREGMMGMRVGGQRSVVVPPDQAYGANPPDGSPIAPDETLIYVVELVDVEASVPGG